MALLSPAEHQQMQRLLRPSSREQFLLSRSLRRLALSAMCPTVLPPAWQFEVSAAGKPAVQGGWPPFNCSHTDGLVACLVDLRAVQRIGQSPRVSGGARLDTGQGRSYSQSEAMCQGDGHGGGQCERVGTGLSEGFGVGIDLEHNNPQRRTAGLAPAVLSLREQAILQGCTPTHQRELFYRLWTLKEAYLKALGVGLQQDAKEVELDLQRGAMQGLQVEPLSTDVALPHAVPQGMHRATVAVPAAVDTLPKEQWQLLSFKLHPGSEYLVALAFCSATPLNPQKLPVLLHTQLPAEK
jgi:phosphopantetheinyl transferase